MADSEDHPAPGPGAASDKAGIEGAGPRPSIPQMGDVATDVSDRVIDLVAKVKARTTLKVVNVLRAVVYGVVALVALVTALVLGVLGVVRMWDAYFPISPLGRRVWLGYVVVGAVLFAGGAALIGWRRSARS